MVVAGPLAALTWDVTECWAELQIKFQRNKNFNRRVGRYHLDCFLELGIIMLMIIVKRNGKHGKGKRHKR